MPSVSTGDEPKISQNQELRSNQSGDILLLNSEFLILNFELVFVQELKVVLGKYWEFLMNSAICPTQKIPF